MSDTNSDEIETLAQQVLDAMNTPKRRVRPRIAEAFRDAIDIEVETPCGPVMSWRLGKGPATLLVHGWEDDNCLWGPIADKCAQLGRAVVAVDLPGHGFTKADMARPHLIAEALIAVAAAQGPIDTIVAHSFGCLVSMIALAKGLDVKRIVMIATPLARTSQRWERIAAKGIPDDVIERVKAMIDAEESVPAPYDMEAEAENMTTRALFVHSLDDDACPVENSQSLKRLWPRSKIILTDELGHRLIAQDSATLDRIIDFVEGFEP
ncbi:MAG: alpha/beta fold hydrolase [Parvibaculum sp.]|nr:alpha/beta fold hydrolase [Parvibaculum sp.]